MRYCEHCGAEILDGDVYEFVDGEAYCSECFEELKDSGKIMQCDDCGEWFLEDQLRYVDFADGYYCDGCFEEKFQYCDDCGRLDWADDVRYSEEYERYICDSCIDNHYYHCDECGCLVHEEDLYWDEYGEYGFCDYCWHNRESSGLHDYGYKPSPIFSKKESETFENTLFMGFELETDGGENRDNYVSDLNDASINTIDGNSAIYCKTDGSLDYGVEIVSHPSTLEYYKSINIFEKIRDIALDYNYRSDKTGTCGFHVHVSRDFFGRDYDTQNYNISKVILLINRFWDNYLSNFTRRRGDMHWCKLNKFSTLHDKETESSIVRKVTRQYDRYLAINLENSKTIEFRIFKGSLNVTTDYAILEFVDRICRYAMDIDINEAINAKWNDIFGKDVLNEFGGYYAELIKYNEIRGLDVLSELETHIPVIQTREGVFYEGQRLRFIDNDSMMEFLDSLREFKEMNGLYHIPSGEGGYDDVIISHINYDAVYEVANTDGAAIEIRNVSGLGSSICLHRDNLRSMTVVA